MSVRVILGMGAMPLGRIESRLAHQEHEGHAQLSGPPTGKRRPCVVRYLIFQLAAT
jgi:hypothetical protein